MFLVDPVGRQQTKIFLSLALFTKNDYGGLKFIFVNSCGLETHFSELKDPVPFLESI